MAVIKEWFQRMRPLRVCIVLVLTTAFFITQLFVSHLTHALTLLVDSYHVLCNIIALAGCIITIKYGSARTCDKESQQTLNNSEVEELKVLSTPLGSVKFAPQNCPQPERELRNTFGWARIDILVMLIGCVFLASLCFSLLVEALQTLIHISHHDEMHHPIPVLCLGITGLFLNLICYFMIGGFTYHQGSFLHVTESGDVVLESVNGKSVSNGQRRLSSQTRRAPVPLQPSKRQGIWETFRDVIGCLIVILCSVIVYFTDQEVGKYVDPILSIVSAIMLLLFSYPYMKESCLILLQTIPDHINIDSLKTELLSAFPDIVNVHDFHVWQLTVNKTFSTVHIIFLNPQVYCRITDDITKFFHCHGITHVTVQPEFFKDLNSLELVSGYGSAQCLVQCIGQECIDCQCCNSLSDLQSVSVTSIPKLVTNEAATVLSIKPINDETPAVQINLSCASLDRNVLKNNAHNLTNGHLTKAATLPDVREVPTSKVTIKTNERLSNGGLHKPLCNGTERDTEKGIDEKISTKKTEDIETRSEESEKEQLNNVNGSDSISNADEHVSSAKDVQTNDALASSTIEVVVQNESSERINNTIAGKKSPNDDEQTNVDRRQTSEAATSEITSPEVIVHRFETDC